MYPLFETICIKDGACQNLEYHLDRFQRSCLEYYGQIPAYPFAGNIIIPIEFQKGINKLKIFYNLTEKQCVFQQYQPNQIKSLKIVIDNKIDYALKYADRDRIHLRYRMKQDCDDILIVKNGRVTDTSYCNIVFHDGGEWVTPSTPLLKGTMRQKLLDAKKIRERKITVQDLTAFKSFKLINAMRDFDSAAETDIENIRMPETR